MGVNPGYHSSLVRDPLTAAQEVTRAIAPLRLDATVYPGRCLHRRCPRGGEVGGAVVLHFTDADFVPQMAALGRGLRQCDVVAVTGAASGTPSRGLVVDLGPEDVDAVALRWQRAAEQEQGRGVYVSAALFVRQGRVCARADASPAPRATLDAWERAALSVLHCVAPGARPVFHSIGYHLITARAFC